MGLAAVIFFWASDPKLGIPGRFASAELVDAIDQSMPGTYVGIAGGIVIAVVGMWLLIRRTT